MKEMTFQSSRALKDFIDFIILLNFRNNEVKNNQSIINSSLRTVGKDVIVNRLYGGMALLLSAGLFLFMLGTSGIYILLQFPFALVIFSIASLIVLSFIFVKILLLPLLSLLNAEKIAILIEKKYPSLNNSLISSIQLARSRQHKKKVEYSEQMVSMLIDTTANQLKNLDISRVISKKLLRLSNMALIVSVLIFGIICVSHRSYFHKNIPLFFRYLIHEKGIGENGIAAYSGPIIGDITIHYRYPLYSGLQPKTIYNSSGNIKALKGSEVQISAISEQPLLSAQIIFNDTTKVPLTLENGKVMNGTLLLLESGIYTFETTDSGGRIFKDTVFHKVQIDPDEFPEIVINTPAKDITVNEKDTVELKYTAKDDFGVHEILLVFEEESERKTKTLVNFSKKQTQYSGAYLWSLSELSLQPEDKIGYHIEVKDNDTISGPKVSRSKTYYLETYSSKKRHQELVHLQEALLRETLHMLSDDFIKRIDDEKCTSKDYLMMAQDGIQERVENISRLFTDILAGMQEDTLANYSIYYSLQNLKDKFHRVTEKKRTNILQSIQNIIENYVPITVLNELQKAQDEEVIEVENIILFLNEIIQKQKMDDVLDTGKSLIQSQNKIEKLLDKLRDGEDAKLSEKALSELKHIEEAIQQMMEKLMEMAQGEHMDEFLNADALKKIEQNDLMKELNAMRDAINKGDLNVALQAAQRMLSALQEMMNQMKSSAQNFADSSFADMLKNTDQLLSKISEIERKERELTEDTEKLKKDIQKRTSESINQTLKSFFETQEKRLEMIKNDLAETKEILVKNELLQEYIQVNRDLKRMAEERDAMASRLGEFLGSDEEVELFQRESRKLAELFGRNAELNREINQDSMQKNFLNLSRELPQTEETLSHLGEMLKGWDLKESFDLAKDMSQNLNQWNSRMQNTLEQKAARNETVPKRDIQVAEKVQDATHLNQQIIKDLESMMQSFEEQQIASMTEEEQENLQKYAEKQKGLQEESEDLMEMTDKLSEQNPFMDETADQQLDMASKSMGKAKEKLDKHDAQGAVIDERESLYRLAEAKKGIEMTKERIGKGMMGSGIPMPMQRPFRGRMDEGQFGASTEKVEIPPEEAYKVPKEFREDILNAMKEGLPEKYKELNKDYYQRLVD